MFIKLVSFGCHHRGTPLRRRRVRISLEIPAARAGFLSETVGEQGERWTVARPFTAGGIQAHAPSIMVVEPLSKLAEGGPSALEHCACPTCC